MPLGSPCSHRLVQGLGTRWGRTLRSTCVWQACLCEGVCQCARGAPAIVLQAQVPASKCDWGPCANESCAQTSKGEAWLSTGRLCSMAPGHSCKDVTATSTQDSQRQQWRGANPRVPPIRPVLHVAGRVRLLLWARALRNGRPGGHDTTRGEETGVVPNVQTCVAFKFLPGGYPYQPHPISGYVPVL